MMLAEGIALALGGLASAYAIVGVAAFKTSYWRVVAVGGSVTFGWRHRRAAVS
jgi:multisubunit Na+/H+ antiporter MnhG subunit